MSEATNLIFIMSDEHNKRVLGCAGHPMIKTPNLDALAARVAPQAAGTPPVGRLVDISLVAWPLSTATAGRVSGTLLSMTGDWVVVKEGTFEHWIPKEKIMNMKASR